MADGHESDRTEAYFYGGMKDRPVPRRLRPRDDGAANEAKSGSEKEPQRQG